MARLIPVEPQPSSIADGGTCTRLLSKSTMKTSLKPLDDLRTRSKVSVCSPNMWHDNFLVEHLQKIRMIGCNGYINMVPVSGKSRRESLRRSESADVTRVEH